MREQKYQWKQKIIKSHLTQNGLKLKKKDIKKLNTSGQKCGNFHQKCGNFHTSKNLFCIFFGGLQCVGHSFAYVAHFVFLRDVSGLEPRALH